MTEKNFYLKIPIDLLTPKAHIVQSMTSEIYIIELLEHAEIEAEERFVEWAKAIGWWLVFWALLIFTRLL